MVEAPELAGSAPCQCVMGEDRHRDGRVGVTDDRIGELGRVHFSPAYCFARRGSGEPAGVGASIGYLQEEVLAQLFDAEHFLNLGLGLEHEILGTAPAPKHDAAAT